MARYTKSVCRHCRREGIKLFLKGERCLGEKCAFSRRAFAPGVHGQRRTKVSEYGKQLREKQKAKRLYGVLEKQFRNYYLKADRRKGITGENLLESLERRLDNVVYRMGLASSRKEARQLVLHRHFKVSGSRVNIPSFKVKPGDTVEVHDSSKEALPIQNALKAGTGTGIPAWLTVDTGALKGTIERVPLRDDINIPINEQLIVELYSK
ncbi:MAG: 30S ribosomal protein S4 [Nitrospinota bacterium]